MKKILVFAMIGLCMINLAYSLDAKMQLRDEFLPNQMIKFSYNISSGTGANVTFTPHIECPDAPVAPYLQRSVNLKPGETYKATHVDQKVSKRLDPQKCTAYLRISKPQQFTVSQNFTIKTKPSQEFDLTISPKVVAMGKTVKIDYQSGLDKQKINARLKGPQGSSKTIDIPTTLKPGKVGTYEIEYTVEAKGYKTLNEQKRFALINSHANVTDKFPEPEVESEKSQEQEPSKPQKSFNYVYLIVAAFLVIFATIFIIVRQKFQ